MSEAGLNILRTWVLESLEKLTTNDQRNAFALALRESITLDMSGHNPPRPSNAFDIRQRYGFSFAEQRNYHISLGKREALQFLAKFGKTGLNTGFNKRYTEQRYRKFFDRDECAKLGRSLLLTYAEWLHFVDFRFEPDLPEELTNILQ